jgi:hypothetical protein
MTIFMTYFKLSGSFGGLLAAVFRSQLSLIRVGIE